MRLALMAAVLGVALGTGTGAHAQEAFRPTRPVELVVHTGAGGGADQLARALITIMEKENLLPVRFAITPRQGGGSTAAMNYLMEKSGDAHTMAVFTNLY